jgi:hypothetical protein
VLRLQGLTGFHGSSASVFPGLHDRGEIGTPYTQQPFGAGAKIAQFPHPRFGEDGRIEIHPAPDRNNRESHRGEEGMRLGRGRGYIFVRYIFHGNVLNTIAVPVMLDRKVSGV